MSLRMLGCSLLLITVAAFKLPVTPASGQAAQEATTEPKWEYRVIGLDPYRCASDEAVAASLNASGQQGWELVSYERPAVPFPRDAEGGILMRPAATGAGKEVTPQLADSFQGEITLKMPQPQPAECRLVLKRHFHLPARP